MNAQETYAATLAEEIEDITLAQFTLAECHRMAAQWRDAFAQYGELYGHDEPCVQAQRQAIHDAWHAVIDALELAHVRRNDILSEATSNTKTEKGMAERGLFGRVLHLAPSWNSGFNTCSHASKGCAAACLYRAGRAAFTRGINESRIRKTRYFFLHREEFLARLVKEIAAHERQAYRRGLRPTLRLNATSDILWEDIPVTRDGIAYPSIMAAFPTVTCYDYTKVATRLTKDLPANYSLTFSLSESNDAHVVRAIARGFNVAAVLRVRKGEAFPTHWNGIPVIDGDEHDYRFLDPKGVIVGLRPKGTAALKDTSGFVHDLDYVLDATRKPDFARNPRVTYWPNSIALTQV